MENFSVATLRPFMKTPKDPESTFWAAGSLSLPDSATADQTSKRHDIPTASTVLNFTFALLRIVALPDSPDFDRLGACRRATTEVPDGRLLPQPPLLHLFPRFRCETWPSSSTAGGSHITGGIPLHRRATDVLTSAPGNGGTTHPRDRPGKWLTTRHLPARRHCLPARKRRPPELRPWGKGPLRPPTSAAPRAPTDGIRLPPTAEKFARWSVVPEPQ